jgi:hypothetical protein
MDPERLTFDVLHDERFIRIAYETPDGTRHVLAKIPSTLEPFTDDERGQPHTAIGITDRIAAIVRNIPLQGETQQSPATQEDIVRGFLQYAWNRGKNFLRKAHAIVRRGTREAWTPPDGIIDALRDDKGHLPPDVHFISSSKTEGNQLQYQKKLVSTLRVTAPKNEREWKKTRIDVLNFIDHCRPPYADVYIYIGSPTSRDERDFNHSDQWTMNVFFIKKPYSSS